MTRRTKRAIAQVFLLAFAGFLIVLGFSGWLVGPAGGEGVLPAQYLGFFLLAYGLLGLLGVNIWYGGPLDPRRDPPKQDEAPRGPRPISITAVRWTVQQEELSFGRVFAVLAVLLFWLPVLGLAAGALAWLLNRKSTGWTYRASQMAFVASGLMHTVLVVLFIIGMS
jgi:hypothetical protein